MCSLYDTSIIQDNYILYAKYSYFANIALTIRIPVDTRRLLYAFLIIGFYALLIRGKNLDIINFVSFMNINACRFGSQVNHNNVKQDFQTSE